MLFNSLEFFLFLPIVFFIYWFILRKNYHNQNILLLIASYVFYGWWDFRFLFLIITSTLVDYSLALWIEKSPAKWVKKSLLSVSILVNIGLLFYFKYYNFFITSLVASLNSVGITFNGQTLNIILPVGISFYTFQTLSYTFDVYRNQLKATKDFISFSAFVAFFPQLVAGPIERAKNLLPQFLQHRYFIYDKALVGINLIVYGLFKKIVVADRLAVYVNSAFTDIEHADSISSILAIVFFSIQIYCDFSGYSDIARGTAKLFGLELMLNFDRPYLAESISEFWTRWHISLSTWFKDYIYIPLGGNKVSSFMWIRNLFVVFIISGFWHGANWTFVIWGALHGTYIICEIYLSKFFSAIKLNLHNYLPAAIVRWIKVSIVYILVCFAWIFFRAQSFDQAVVVIKKIFCFQTDFNLITICAHQGPSNLLISFFVITLLLSCMRLPRELHFTYKKNLCFLIVLIFLIVVLGRYDKTEFIYFQF